MKSLMEFCWFQEGIQTLLPHLFSAECQMETPVWLKRKKLKLNMSCGMFLFWKKSQEHDAEDFWLLHVNIPSLKTGRI